MNFLKSLFNKSPKLFKIRIILNSGIIQDVTCSSFEVLKQVDNTISEIRWKDLQPNCLYIRLKDISAIFVL